MTDLMYNLFAPALCLVLCPADRLPLKLTVLHQGLLAHLLGLVEGYHHHLYKTHLQIQ